MRNPDGAQRNRGQPIKYSRVTLRSTRELSRKLAWTAGSEVLRKKIRPSANKSNIVEHDWQGADLEALIKLQLGPYPSDDDERIVTVAKNCTWWISGLTHTAIAAIPNGRKGPVRTSKSLRNNGLSALGVSLYVS